MQQQKWGRVWGRGRRRWRRAVVVAAAAVVAVAVAVVAVVVRAVAVMIMMMRAVRERVMRVRCKWVIGKWSMFIWKRIEVGRKLGLEGTSVRGRGAGRCAICGQLVMPT